MAKGIFKIMKNNKETISREKGRLSQSSYEIVVEGEYDLFQIDSINEGTDISVKDSIEQHVYIIVANKKNA